MEEEKKEAPLVVARKLASVQLISSITPLNDQLDIVKVLGWQVVTLKNDFKPGDKIVYFEIDSKLPEWFTELEMDDYRAKTSVIAGVISQGIIKPITCVKDHEKYQVGDDLSEVLEVGKYDDEGKIISAKENKEFPISVVPKTDEPRIQSEPRYLEVFKGKSFVASLKYDGTSGTFLLDPTNKKDLWVASRNKLVAKGKQGGEYWAIAEKYKLAQKLQKFPDLAIQGEVYGAGIQKNPFKLKEKRLAVFTIKSLSLNRCLDYDEMVETCKELDLPYAEAIVRGDNFNFSLDELIELAKGKYQDTENEREGLVFRLAKYWDTPCIRASFKVINNDYLIQNAKK